MKIDQMKMTPGHLLRRAHQISSALFSEEMADFELTSIQFMALATIIETHGIDATRLAEIIAFDKATIGGVVERLERKGLIERVASTADRRIKILKARPAARALIQVCVGGVAKTQDRILEPLAAEERTMFLCLLAKVARESQ